MKTFFATLVFFTIPLFSWASQTDVVRHHKFEDFLAGELKNFSAFKFTGLQAGANLAEFATIPADIIFDLVENTQGTLFAATGNKGKVFSISVEGEVKTVFTSEELFARAIALDGKGNLFVGTSPKGKVYKIDPSGEVSLFFDPQTAFIWDMAFDSTGHLLVSTGQPAKLFKVPPRHLLADKLEPIFTFEQNHFTTIALRLDDSMILGTSPDALLFDLKSDGTIQRTINAPGLEITEIVLAGKEVFFSTLATPNQASKPDTNDAAAKILSALQNNSSSNSSNDKSNTPASALYHWKENGFLDTIWDYEKFPILSFRQSKSGWLIGSGDDGHLFYTKSYDDWGIWTQLDKGGDINNILTSLHTPGKTYFASSNPAAIYVHSEQDTESTATYTSSVIDAGKIVSWGKLHILGQQTDTVKAKIRFGNTEKPDRSWSDWHEIEQGDLPPAQYAQYEFATDNPNTVINQVKWYYRLANQAPKIGRINVAPVGIGVLDIPKKDEEQINIKNFFDGEDFENILINDQNNRRKFYLQDSFGKLSVGWQANDPNGDRLTFSVFIRKVDQEDWILLAKELDFILHSFSTEGLAPGYYQIKVKASDSPSHEESEALSSYTVSESFLLDNTKPVITYEGMVKKSQNETVLEFTVEDNFSVISQARFFIDGEAGHSISPVDRFFDQTKEKFSLKLSGLSVGIHSLIFEVEDESRNESVHQMTFTIN